MAVSRDRGQTFAKAVTISAPSQVGPGATYVYPEIDAAGNLYVSVVSFPPNGRRSTIYVARSTDDGRTFSAFVPVTTVTHPAGEAYPNTRFRSGIVESFAASPTYPDHLYLTYEDWDSVAGQADVKFTQSTDGGATWTTPVVVNDNVDTPGPPTDQFQPSVAAGPDGAVAVAFYDRREACPSDPSVLPADVGRTNFCIDTSLQAYKDSGSGAVPVGSERAHLAVHLGSGAAGTASRRPLPVSVRRSHGSLRNGQRIHRRLLRAGHLGGQHLRAHGLDPLPVNRDRRRRRPDLLPATGAGHSAAEQHRHQLLVGVADLRLSVGVHVWVSGHFCVRVGCGRIELLGGQLIRHRQIPPFRIGLDLAAGEQTDRVPSVTIAQLGNELNEAADERVPVPGRVVARYGRLDLLLCGEVGYVRIDPRGAELQVQAITAREEGPAIALPQTLPFSGWGSGNHRPPGCSS